MRTEANKMYPKTFNSFQTDQGGIKGEKNQIPLNKLFKMLSEEIRKQFNKPTGMIIEDTNNKIFSQILKIVSKSKEGDHLTQHFPFLAPSRRN